MSELEAIRLDKWLWTARFFKTRKLAAEAISGGKVHVSEQRTKPGKEVKVGAMLSISKDNYRWEVTIVAINGQRRSAKEAVLLYEESAESLAKREKQIIQNREQRELFDFSGKDHKPNKKERRLIHQFKQG
ncbi:RNA-binding S4 domain-containing protein [Methylobacter tundripaludum]|uniref:Heat shock protein 15 n=1 Tax=Methylobacter tundripaludum (strain ATCC BAA-1195 / DSM 17260 / SV96) TaxID=697282 RepID=G3ISS8_METTV|nr:S4 domain-containing protein [Methylobacter tundripaludum]EGW21288.1 RNA-binding S4 domain protein [Methylobacter tundripaludum SV96]